MKVYLISAEIDNSILYKIGYTKRSVDKRLKELKTGNAAELKIVNVFESKFASKIESNLHRRYKNISGEWFTMDDAEVSNFNDVCKLVHDNFELLAKTNLYVIEKKIL